MHKKSFKIKTVYKKNILRMKHTWRYPMSTKISTKNLITKLNCFLTPTHVSHKQRKTNIFKHKTTFRMRNCKVIFCWNFAFVFTIINHWYTSWIIYYNLFGQCISWHTSLFFMFKRYKEYIKKIELIGNYKSSK